MKVKRMKKVPIVAYVPETFHRALRADAKAQGITLTAIVRDLLTKYLAKRVRQQ